MDDYEHQLFGLGVADLKRILRKHGVCEYGLRSQLIHRLETVVGFDATSTERRPTSTTAAATSSSAGISATKTCSDICVDCNSKSHHGQVKGVSHITPALCDCSSNPDVDNKHLFLLHSFHSPSGADLQFSRQRTSDLVVRMRLGELADRRQAKSFDSIKANGSSRCYPAAVINESSEERVVCHNIESSSISITNGLLNLKNAKSRCNKNQPLVSDSSSISSDLPLAVQQTQRFHWAKTLVRYAKDCRVDTLAAVSTCDVVPITTLQSFASGFDKRSITTVSDVCRKARCCTVTEYLPSEQCEVLPSVRIQRAEHKIYWMFADIVTILDGVKVGLLRVEVKYKTESVKRSLLEC